MPVSLIGKLIILIYSPGLTYTITFLRFHLLRYSDVHYPHLAKAIQGEISVRRVPRPVKGLRVCLIDHNSGVEIHAIMTLEIPHKRVTDYKKVIMCQQTFA